MDWKPIIDQIMPIFITFLVTAFTIILGLAINQLKNWAASKAKNEDVKTAIIQIEEAAKAASANIEATIRKGLPPSGMLSQTEKTELRATANDMVTSQAPAAIAVLEKSGMENMPQFVSGKIEQAVADAKKSA